MNANDKSLDQEVGSHPLPTRLQISTGIVLALEQGKLSEVDLPELEKPPEEWSASLWEKLGLSPPPEQGART